MKCPTHFKVPINRLIHLLVQLCIVKLLLIDNVFTFKSPPAIVRHPGTCTFQQSQAACTFSLLCYLAGGIPVEGCGNGATTTCCVLQHTPSVQQILDYSKVKSDEKTLDHQKTNAILRDSHTVPSSSITYSDTDQSSQPIPTGDSQVLPKNGRQDNHFQSASTESSLTTEDESTSQLHSSSSSLSASTNSFDPLAGGYQTHQIHHSPRSLYSTPKHPSSLQYHHRLQHSAYSATNAHHHLNHQKQHQQNLYLHHQRLTSNHPSLNHHNSLYHTSIYHQPHYHTSPYHSTSQTSPNARSFQPARYNDPLLAPYQSNYLLNNNINYYAGDSSTFNTDVSVPSYVDHLNSFSGSMNDQTANTNSYPSIGGLTSPTSHSIVSPNAYNSNNNNAQSNEPDGSPAYLNDYSNQSPASLPSVPSSSSLLSSSYRPTQTIDYKTYQKHFMNPAYLNNDHLSFPSLYSTSPSTSSYETTTNHTTNSLNSNKMYDPKTSIVSDYTTAAEPPASIKYYNQNHLSKNPTDYEPPAATNHNTQPDDSPSSYDPPSVNSEEDNRLVVENGRLIDEDEYNGNAIRRSRLSASPLNSITIERETQARSFIGDDVCGKPVSKPTARIIGGQDARPFEFPWVVHIKVGAHQCGGTLISRDYVATAAHCVYQAPLDKLTLIIGAHDIELKNSKYYEEIPQHHLIESVLLHPNFRFSAAHPDRFDIALLKLKRPALYTNAVRPICLPPRQLKLEGWRGVVTGWGKTDSQLANRYGTRLLQKVDVPIIKNQECEKWHQTRGIDIKIFSEMMCAGYENGEKDACVGDSGGPLIIYLNGRWTLAGITSAGFGCAQSKQPGIYHRVSFTVDWILDQLSNT